MDECILHDSKTESECKKTQAEANLIGNQYQHDIDDSNQENDSDIIVHKENQINSEIISEHHDDSELIDQYTFSFMPPQNERIIENFREDNSSSNQPQESSYVFQTERKEEFKIMHIENDDYSHQKQQQISEQKVVSLLDSDFEIPSDINNIPKVQEEIKRTEQEIQEEVHDNKDQIRIVMIGESKIPPNCCDLLELHEDSDDAQETHSNINNIDGQQSSEVQSFLYDAGEENTKTSSNQRKTQNFTKSQKKQNQNDNNNNNNNSRNTELRDIAHSIIEEDDQEMEKSISEEGVSLEVEDILSMSDERMLHRKVLISEPELITEGYITTYKLYRIKSKEDGCVVFETEVLRRFSDFEWLYNELINKYGGYLIPVLPEKNILTKFNVETNDFTKHRQRNLEFFLQKLLDHPKLHAVPQLKLFICARNEVFSLVKGEAESQKTIEQKYQNVLGSVKNYIQQSIVPLFGGAGNNQGESKSNTETTKESSELDKELNNYEVQFQSLSTKVRQLMKICELQSALMEEELSASNQINYHYSQFLKSSMKFPQEKEEQLGSNEGEKKDLTKKEQEILMNQTVLNLKENATFQWQKQFQPSIEVWFKNCLAAEEALNRRKEIVQQILKDSRRIQELSQLNKKLNNQRDTEMDILQNNQQKNKQKLETINGILGTEIKQFDIDQQIHYSQLLQKFKEIQQDLHYKSNEIYQGRIPSLI